MSLIANGSSTNGGAEGSGGPQLQHEQQGRQLATINVSGSGAWLYGVSYTLTMSTFEQKRQAVQSAIRLA